MLSIVFYGGTKQRPTIASEAAQHTTASHRNALYMQSKYAIGLAVASFLTNFDTNKGVFPEKTPKEFSWKTQRKHFLLFFSFSMRGQGDIKKTKILRRFRSREKTERSYWRKSDGCRRQWRFYRRTKDFLEDNVQIYMSTLQWKYLSKKYYMRYSNLLRAVQTMHPPTVVNIVTFRTWEDTVEVKIFACHSMVPSAVWYRV